MITHVQGLGNSAGFPSGAVSVVLPTVGAGHTLIASFGYARLGVFAQSTMPVVTDDQGNIWFPLGMTPAQEDGSSNSWQMISYIAYNVAGGTTTVTVTIGWRMTLIVDEYSGVASVQAVDQQTFNSTYLSGLNTVNSGSITIPANEMLHSVGFSDDLSTLSASAGFNNLENVTLSNFGVLQSLATFNRAPGAGTYNNIITASGVPNNLHVMLFSLSSSPIGGPVQINCNVDPGSFFATTVSAEYLLPNYAGDILIAAARINERGDCSISDSFGNSWVTVYGANSTSSGGFCFGFALNCKAGTGNIVTINTGSGGSDASLSMIIAEYLPPSGAIFSSSNMGITLSGTSVDTGSISASGVELLVSCFVDNFLSTNGPVGSSPQTRRFQWSGAGEISTSPATVCIADQTVSSSGSYDNLFTASNSSALLGAILGFKKASGSENRLHVFVVT